MAKLVKEQTKPLDGDIILTGNASTALTNAEDEYERFLEETAGEGTTQAAEDVIIPLVYILQSNSPQVQAHKKDDYIEGAVPGTIWLRPQHIILPGEPLYAQPCYFSKDWVEWVPRERGGGRVASYLLPPDDTVEREDAKTGRKSFVRTSNGNNMVETRYHTCIFRWNGGRAPWVFPMKSTMHTVSKTWNSQINSFHTRNDLIAAAYTHEYLITPVLRKNSQGEWFIVKIQDVGEIYDMRRLQEGKALHEAMKSGAKKVEIDENAGVVENEDIPF